MRQGDRICRHCGCVQNTRSVESQEEEHRTFADDDKKESKMRTSVMARGGGGGIGGNKSLAQAHALAQNGADAEDGLTEKDRKRIEAYRSKVRGAAWTDCPTGPQRFAPLSFHHLEEFSHEP